MVVPIGSSGLQIMTVVERTGADSFEYSNHGSFVFVPMLKGVVNGN